MADTTKAQKLAYARKLVSARKKLKEQQQKSIKPEKVSADAFEPSDLSATQNSVNIVTHVTYSQPVENNNGVHADEGIQSSESTQLYNYFKSSEEVYKNPSTFFDHLAVNEEKPLPKIDDVFHVDAIVDKNISSDNSQLNNCSIYFSNRETIKSERESSVVTPVFSDVRTEDDPGIAKIQCSMNVNRASSTEHPSVSLQDAMKLTEYMTIPQEAQHVDYAEDLTELNRVNVDIRDYENRAELKNLFDGHSYTEETAVIDKLPIETEVQHFLASNAESLRQLSSQINHFVKEETISDMPQPSFELEKRNQELAALLERERLETENLRAEIEQDRMQITKLESLNQQTKIDYENRLNRELGPLQEQLQSHAQTLGILVGERTELSTALTQSQLVAKQKLAECEELQGRLKTSRSRVVSLENDIQNLKSRSSENNIQEEMVSKLQREVYEFKQQKDEAVQDVLELREKLNVKANENLNLQHEVQQVTHQLSLAQVKIQQIAAFDSLQTEGQVETLMQQKLVLEKQVAELNQALKAATTERDQASAQYQRYVQQLNSQVTSLAAKLETISQENESLAKREQNLIRHVGELEKHLSNLQDERLSYATNKSNSEANKDIEAVMDSVENLQERLKEVQESWKQTVEEKKTLEEDLEVKKEEIEHLGNLVEQLQSNQPDSGKLLAAMESDKIAASRAVAQNTQLKQELEEMQQAFVKASNDKLELADTLTSEQFKNKDLAEKLAQYESQLQMLSDAITIKDRELTEIRDSSTELTKQLLSQDQLADRLRHYEAQESGTQSLQIELQESKHEIQLLTSENVKLKKILNNLRHAPSSISNSSDIPIETQSLIEGTPQDSLSNNDDLNVLDKEEAMKHLELKFTRTMRDIAELTEEKLRLEHLVLQLQGETETIGEYIALYQHQRGVLKQRTQEKDEQLKRLAFDRDQVRNKLDLLNGLVKKLVVEKEGVAPEIVAQHANLHKGSEELCTEHAELHNEIAQVKITASDVHEFCNGNSETAEQIMALLSEIKSSNLVQPSDGSESFHPCPWCSGQLLNV